MTYGVDPREEPPAVPVPGPRQWADAPPAEPPRTQPLAGLDALAGGAAPPGAGAGQPAPVSYRQPAGTTYPGQAAPFSAPPHGQAPPASSPPYGQAAPGSAPPYASASPPYAPAYAPASPASAPPYGQAPPAGQVPAARSGTAPPAAQPGGYPQPYPAPYPPQSVPPAVSGGPPGATAPARRRRSWPGVAALLLVVVLMAVAGFQAYQIDRLSQRLADTDRRLAEAQSGDGTRLDGLEGRASQLEKRAGDVFNPEAISSAVLPSVFRVRAGAFTGTAFAVGRPASGGGTNLFTNWHVVQAVWDGGGRQVFLERTSQRYPATIVKVDKDNDVAQLRTDSRFTGLTAAPAAVKPGQQIIVVGAPLGLEDSVTTGVVSAQRKIPDIPGTMIQFDAPINPGNSGGPVINGAKQVIGIATAKRSDAEGIGLAVPIKTACDGFKICTAR